MASHPSRENPGKKSWRSSTGSLPGQDCIIDGETKNSPKGRYSLISHICIYIQIYRYVYIMIFVYIYTHIWNIPIKAEVSEKWAGWPHMNEGLKCGRFPQLIRWFLHATLPALKPKTPINHKPQDFDECSLTLRYQFGDLFNRVSRLLSIASTAMRFQIRLLFSVVSLALCCTIWHVLIRIQLTSITTTICRL